MRPPRLPLTLLRSSLHPPPLPRLTSLLLHHPSPPHHQTPRTTFHYQRRTFLTSILYTTSTSLTTLSTLLTTPGFSPPWYLLLPLSALILRTSTTLPLTLYARKICAQVARLQPVLSAWGRVIGTRIAKGDEQRFLESRGRSLSKADINNPQTVPTTYTLTPYDWAHQTQRLSTKKQREVLHAFHCQKWKAYLPTLQIPIWVLASLTLRGMTSEPSNLAEPGYITQLLDNIPLEPSLAHGGALWFPDLLAPDPLYVLPIMLSLSMFANIEFQALQYPAVTRQGRIMKGVMRALAVGVIPLVMQTPVALTLYWLSSSLYSLVQNIVLHFWWPMPKIVTPCKPKALLGYEAQETPATQ